MLRKGIWKNFDFWLFGAVVILTIFGIAMIQSAVAGSPEIAGYPSRQAVFAGLGLGVIFIVSILDYHIWASFSRLMYAGVMFLLIVIFVVGKVSFGAARWLDVGFAVIQPAELAKIVMIIVLANYFTSNKDKPKDLNWIIRSLILTGLMVLWVYLQPNLSTSIVIFVIWFSMLWISGLPPKFILIFALVGLVGFIILFPFLEPYQQGRILTFILPDPNATYGNTYNVEQALISIGSGGLLGMGYGSGTQVQLRFLKVRHTDFIFSAMAEEFGFIGTVLIVGLLIFVILRCFRAAKLAADPFGALLAYGFGVLMFFQTIVNIGVNLKVIPVTGLTLPFISYGGSSLMSMTLGIGLVESVIARRKVN